MEHNEEQETAIEIMSSDIVLAQDRAMVDSQIATAKHYPRNILKATSAAIAIVGIDQETAKTCTYSVPRGGKPITGPSVHLAKILAQVWGNMRVEAKVVAIDAKTVTSEAVAFDLETNLAIKTQVKRSIVGKNGRFSEDMITVTGNAANAIALRNAILSVVPRAIVDKVYNAAKQAITGDISDKTKLIAKRKQVIDALKDTFGVTEKEILTAVGKAAVEHVDADDLVVLIGIGTAIKDGDTTVEQAFKKESIAAEKKETQKEKIKKATGATEVVTFEELNELFEKHWEKMDALAVGEVKRIIDAKEEESYAKAKGMVLKAK